MEVVAATPNGGGVSPFHNHDVCEWSCVDSLTGVLERARRETDHWTANTSNSTHKYGKVVDCRARSGVDGNLQQEARRQLEVFQSQIPGGRLQVIKTHSVSSSRWTNKFSQEPNDLSTQTFEDLQLNLNPLDVTSQKSKASVGRSNVGRRPPTRQQRIRNESTTSKNHDTPSVANLYRVSRLCHQIHDSAVKQYIQRPSIHERQSGDGSVAINDIETNQVKNNEERSKATRTSSTSSEDSHLTTTQNQYSILASDKEKSTKSIEDLEDLEKLRDWRRTSKLRRSFQLPRQNKTASKPTDLPVNNGSVRKIREDIEKGRRLNTALRGNNVNLETLDQILQSITNPSLGEYNKFQNPEKETEEGEEKVDELLMKSKKNSFVTVESIKEVRDRLRRTSSPIDDIYNKSMDQGSKEQIDDGIVTELPKSCSSDKITSKVRSYIYGMENSLSKKSVNGTGSLESRSKHLNNNSTCRNEDWYNRRKSYGFERMYNQHDDSIAKIKTTDSSTDSGICRSSEIPTNTTEEPSKPNEYYLADGSDMFCNTSFSYNHYNFEKEKWKRNDIENTTINIPIISQNARKLFEKELNESDDVKRHSIAVDESKYVFKNTEPKFRRTSLAMNSSDLYLNNDEDNFLQGRKPKKVEFCKTEVHFTAESGKVNIVETDEKPPPTNNFRRRRRNSGLMLDGFRTNGLPMFKFGDDLLNDENNVDDFSNEEDTLQNIRVGLVTVNSSPNGAYYDIEEDARENLETEIPKGILKNKPIRPKPYILGDSENYLSKNFDNFETFESNPWDIKLNPIKTEPPIWRSTVTVRNTLFDNVKDVNGDSDVNDDYTKSDTELPEFQKLLKNLRPISKTSESSPENISSSFNGIRIVSPSIDTRRSSWSVIDRIKHAEDQQLMESKGYSTKVNIGNGEATVIENNNKQTNRHPTWPRKEETSQDLDRMQSVVDTKAKRMLVKNGFEKRETQESRNHVFQTRNSIKEAKHSSPIVLHKAFSSSSDTGTKFDIVDKLSSPGLVGKSTLHKQTFCDSSTLKEEFVTNSKAPSSSEKYFKKIDSLERPTHKKSTQNLTQQKVRNRSPGKEVLRQPKKSEMAYFGIPVSPQTTKKQIKQNKLSEKPDLLQFTQSNKGKECDIGTEEAVYENVESVRKKQTSVLTRDKREFDSSILEELTRAADQILQAVNGYTDEDSENNKNHHLRKPLDTISETKSWKQNTKTNNTHSSQNKGNNTKTKARLTSSNSSVESVNKEIRKPSASSGHKLSASTSSVDQKKVTRKVTSTDNNTAKANVKARRLQRASSREALLQSHGSSSEDLPVVVEVPLRKPRLVRKNRSTHSVATNRSLEGKTKSESVSNKREDSSNKNKPDSRVPTVGLPEIRHKTAVSTIRSTAERTASREKTEKVKPSESKRKPLQKRDPRGMPAAIRSDKNKNSSGRENSSQRTSTANMKKCIRYEGS